MAEGGKNLCAGMWYQDIFIDVTTKFQKFSRLKSQRFKMINFGFGPFSVLAPLLYVCLQFINYSVAVSDPAI